MSSNRSKLKLRLLGERIALSDPLSSISYDFESAYSEDSHQPAYPLSLVGVFAVRKMNPIATLLTNCIFKIELEL